MTNNTLSIHIESSNIFYQNFNTNENFHNFLLGQQDKTKRIIPKRIGYHHIFGKYIKNYLPSFSIDEVETFDLYSNKNSKYLLYKFNDWIESLGAEKPIIRHMSKAEDSCGLKKIEEKNKQFLIEKIIYDIENKNPYIVSTEGKPEIMLEIEKTYGICRRVYQSLFADVAYTFIEYIQSLGLDEIQQMDEDENLMGGELNTCHILKIPMICYVFFKCFTTLTTGSL